MQCVCFTSWDLRRFQSFVWRILLSSISEHLTYQVCCFLLIYLTQVLYSWQKTGKIMKFQIKCSRSWKVCKIFIVAKIYGRATEFWKRKCIWEAFILKSEESLEVLHKMSCVVSVYDHKYCFFSVNQRGKFGHGIIDFGPGKDVDKIMKFLLWYFFAWILLTE